MKFGQLIKYNVRNIFLKKSCRKSSRKASFRTLLLKEALYKVKASRQHLTLYGFSRKIFLMLCFIN